MSTLKEKWQKVGDDLEILGKDLGDSIVKTVKTGVKAVSDWANQDDEAQDGIKADTVIEPEEKKE